MKLVKLSRQHKCCPKCGKDACCSECNRFLGYCPYCGEDVTQPEVFIALTVEKYNGADKPANHTATLLIDCETYAMAHIEPDESDACGDVAYMHLSFIPENMRTELTAKITGNFADWIHFDRNNPDKLSTSPTVVRLLGITTYKRDPPPL